MTNIEQKEKLGESKTKPATGELSEGTRKRFIDFIDTRIPSTGEDEASAARQATYPVSDRLIQTFIPVSSIRYSLSGADSANKRAKPALGSLGLEEPPKEPEDSRGGTIAFNVDLGPEAAPEDQVDGGYVSLMIGIRPGDGSAFVGTGDDSGRFHYKPADDQLVEGYLDRIEAVEQVGGISSTPVSPVSA